MKPEDVTELPQFHGKTWMDEEFLLMDEQRKWLLAREFTPVKIVEMTQRIYYIKHS